jgi:hypothetical protein
VQFKILFVGLSLLLASCGSGPKVTICIVDSNNNGLQCVDAKDKAFFVPIAQADNYVALPPGDMRTLIEYCGLKNRDKVAVLNRADKIEMLASQARRHFNEPVPYSSD